jgi:plastocyanin
MKISASIPVLLVLLASLGSSLTTGCGDDQELPEAEAEVEVRPTDFFPDSVSISAGSRVLWVNRQPSGIVRTVTSGTGSSDSTAGALFDAVLDGFEKGEKFGDTFVFRFNDPGVYPYFNRIDGEFSGVVTVN